MISEVTDDLIRKNGRKNLHQKFIFNLKNAWDLTRKDYSKGLFINEASMVQSFCSHLRWLFEQYKLPFLIFNEVRYHKVEANLVMYKGDLINFTNSIPTSNPDDFNKSLKEFIGWDDEKNQQSNTASKIIDIVIALKPEKARSEFITSSGKRAMMMIPDLNGRGTTTTKNQYEMLFDPYMFIECKFGPNYKLSKLKDGLKEDVNKWSWLLTLLDTPSYLQSNKDNFVNIPYFGFALFDEIIAPRESLYKIIKDNYNLQLDELKNERFYEIKANKNSSYIQD